jgi:prophage regulatory protein
MKTEHLRTVTHIRFLREPELLARTGLSPSSVDSLEARGEFPLRVPIGEHAVGWVESEIEAWQRGRIALRDDPSSEQQARRKRRVPSENAAPT